jgi:hypothetical protein
MLGDLGASAAPMARAAGMQVRLLVGWCGLRGHLWGLALRHQASVAGHSTLHGRVEWPRRGTACPPVGVQ